ncbi:MAG: biotin--[acetyl-CoA-carboxylase] ligase [Bacteroidales bacterium]|nr:biotin--[acetyl-CoA-carboxylase] ligase [Bacteroidales bacterium]MCK9497948.1 biotin--[acetyl-CoA-carboxylase] ligase [Bacteroidales bacterium]MDY0315180.1 biotin--[acetyl-CoA-carboxylase] ligase [Bacteroidales bacterium]
MKIIKLEKINSTNLYAQELLNKKQISETTLIYTNSQIKGKGMGENSWYSEDYKNLIFSLLVFNKFKAIDHFKISIIVSLSIFEYLNLKGVSAKIKWPNDIYLKSKKIAGILIENSIMGDFISNSIIGIGLNLNQEKFPKNLTNAISLKNETNIEYNIEEETFLLSNIIIKNFEKYKLKSFEFLRDLYLKNLYKFQEKCLFQSKFRKFEGIIKGIDNFGYLLIELNGNIEKFYFKEIEFID